MNDNLTENSEELLFAIHVLCTDAWEVEGKKIKVVMVPFIGQAEGKYFNGKIIGSGCDTQKYPKDGQGTLSARYMLEGTDISGEKCRVFIENSIHDESGWHPFLVTDSKALSFFEDLPLRADVTGAPGGVLVQIYCKKNLLP